MTTTICCSRKSSPLVPIDGPRRMGPCFRRDDAKCIPWDRGGSIHLLVGVDAPQPRLFDPAIETIAGNTAPASRAMLDLGDDASLQAGGDRAGGIGALVERREVVLALHGDHGGAATRQQRMI